MIPFTTLDKLRNSTRPEDAALWMALEDLQRIADGNHGVDTARASLEQIERYLGQNDV